MSFSNDETGNRSSRINDAVKVIGKSKDRLNVFEAIYFGKSKIKEQEEIRKRSNLPNTKRVLEEGRKLAIEGIIKQIKINGKTAYEKNDFYAKNKNHIISRVKKPQSDNNSTPKKSIIKSAKIQVQRKISKRKKFTKKWDVFICHATEDKKSVAKPLANRLKKEGLEVWYDEFELDWGSRLMHSINTGLKNSLFGIVILSNQFFKKEWAQRELEGLHALSIANEENKILPLLYKLTHKELTNLSPLLADIVYKKWDVGLDAITKSVKKLVNKRKIL